jgi:hypothetical protein
MDMRSIIRWLLDIGVAMLLAFGGWTFAKVNSLERAVIEQAHRIGTVEDAITAFTSEVTRLRQSVDRLVTEAEFQTRLRKYQVADRWTSDMMEDFQAIWYDIIIQHHGEITLREIPNVKEIQRRHLDAIQRGVP